MIVLRRFLLYIRNLLDRLILKLDSPQPISFKPFPEFIPNTITSCIVNYDPNGIYLDGSADTTFTANTYNGSSTGINIYDEY